MGRQIVHRLLISFPALLGVLFLNQSLGLAAALGAAQMLGAGAWVAAEPKAGTP